MNYSDNNKFFTFTWTDETSMFDPKGRWVGGCEYYEREYSCRIPLRIKDKEELINEFIERHMNDEGFWVN